MKREEHQQTTVSLLQRRADVGDLGGRSPWPMPTTDEPDLELLEEWFDDTGCVATDGCWVEHDGVCEHGHPSWLLALGLI